MPADSSATYDVIIIGAGHNGLPCAGYADYRTPVKGLYLCVSGAHPGAGVSGLPGHHAAQAILKDWKRGRAAA